MSGLRIGEFARRAWLTPKALRLYDERGLLVPTHVEASSGYRLYAEEQLLDARLIALLRRMDMPLEQIADVLGTPPSARAELVQAFSTARAEEYARRETLADWLTEVLPLERLDGYGATMGHVVRWRHVETQQCATATSVVTARELPDAIARGIRQAVKRITADGDEPGQPFVIFHDEVGWDSAGRVRICVPATRGRAGDWQDTAHEQAYVELRPDQLPFPAVLSAYEAVYAEVKRAGREVTGPPREIYPTWSPDSSPEAVDCQVAVPVHCSGG